ncbi:MAG: EamA family transporter [Clostridiaceae bacterium]|nr:EamA family transporter [Clostridiaceae bacterium]
MFMYVFSIILIVGSNILYNLSQKSTPQKVNPFYTLLITYLTAAILTLIASFFYKSDKGFLESIKDLNWTSIALGVSIVGLELGYLMAYRAGWNISVGSLVANIILAVILIPIGVLFFKEGFGLNKILGAALCIFGLVLINK